MIDWAMRLNWALISKVAKRYLLDPELVGSVVQVESSGNSFAMKYEPGYRWTHSVEPLAKKVGTDYATMTIMQKTSFGLMQVMGGVFYEYNNHAGAKALWAGSMLDPEIGLEYGCKHLAQKANKYGPQADRIYAAYNGGSVRLEKNGDFENKKNVDRFMRYYNELKGILPNGQPRN